MNKSEGKIERTKFKFGRNPLSFIIVVVSLAIIIFAAITISSYVKTWNDNKVTPFVSSSDDGSNNTKYKNSLPTGFALQEESENYIIKRMDGKDFNLFDFKIECREYGQLTNGSATFDCSIKANDNIKEKAKVLKDLDTNKRNIQFAFCFAADWVGMCTYATSISKYQISYTAEDPTTFTKSISGLSNFPLTANTFPVPIKVYTPDLYVCITFSYESGGVKTENYILKYTYNDYHVDGVTIGGYVK